ncbi:MAG: dihydroorotase [Proteobacteria bacterium]|nr:dihydroorotase [Pseudomonadota bacterium]
MSAHLIANARMVNEGVIIDGDLLISDGRIQGINLPAPANCTVTDAQGAWLIPGMIDDQVHFREPGFEHKGTIATESRAAIAGGITSYMEMPNCNPLTTNQTALIDKRHRAAAGSLANFAFYLGATNDNLEDIKTIDQSLPCGVKVFMGASTGNMLVDNPATLEGIFSSTPLIIATHCEDTPTILANEKAATERFGEAIPFSEHPNIRSAEACWKSSSMAVGLARKYGSRLHVLHLTTAREMELFTPGPVTGKRITAEACVHHLFFDDTWYEVKGSAIKCNPAIKTSEDRQAIMRAVIEDRIDVIATDHAPHTSEEKSRPYTGAPAGLPLVQHALPSLFEHIHNGVLTIEQVVNKTAHAPAQLFSVRDRGYLREGYWADLVLVERGADSTPVFSKCGWSPFEGIAFSHRIKATWVNGNKVYESGRILPGAMGIALEFDR